MRKAHLGIKMPPFTQEHREKIRKTLTGTKRPAIVGERISKAKKGKPRLNQRGALSRWWKGGRTALKLQIKNLLQYKEWRLTCYERDDYRCNSCGKKGGKLECHHIKAFSKILDEYRISSIEEAINCSELWDLNNGATLCRECHGKTPNYGRPKKVTLV